MSNNIIKRLTFEEAFEKGYLHFYCVNPNGEKGILNISLEDNFLATEFYITSELSESLSKSPVLQKAGNIQYSKHSSSPHENPSYANTFSHPDMNLDICRMRDIQLMSFNSNISRLSDIDHIMLSLFEKLSMDVHDIYLPEYSFYYRIKNSKQYKENIFLQKFVNSFKYNYSKEEQFNYNHERYSINKNPDIFRSPDEFLTFEILEGPIHCISLPKEGSTAIGEGTASVDNFLKYNEVDIELVGFDAGAIHVPKYKLLDTNPKELTGWYVLPYLSDYLVEGDSRVIFSTRNNFFFKTKEDALSFRKDKIEMLQKIFKEID